MNRYRALLLVLLLSPAVIYAQQDSSEVVTLEGQLVCSECWFEADRKTTPYGDEADITCAKECAEKGIPSAIAVKEGDTYKLYLIEIEKLKGKTLNLARPGWKTSSSFRPPPCER